MRVEPGCQSQGCGIGFSFLVSSVVIVVDLGIWLISSTVPVLGVVVPGALPALSWAASLTEQFGLPSEPSSASLAAGLLSIDPFLFISSHPFPSLAPHPLAWPAPVHCDAHPSAVMTSLSLSGPPYSLLILLLLLSLAHQALSRSDVIETSSVSYCSTPLAIILDTFDVRYYSSNNSLEFDLSAASVAPGLNLEAQLSLNAYGMNALNLSINLCSVLSGVLCPLPTYNFTGSGGYTIPPANLPSIPGIAWVVPDIEAVITVLLTDTTSNAPAACLQVTLTNGLTVRQDAVSWSTAAVLVASFFMAVVQPHQFGILFLILSDQLQHMAMSGMMSLNYPAVFRTWTTNFAYAVGLIPSGPISRAVDRLRDRTGGNGFTTAQDLVAFTSRLFSPYNQLSDSSVELASAPRARNVITQLLAAATVVNNSQSPADRHIGELVAKPSTRENYVVPVVTQNTTLLDPGLAAYVNELEFPVENAFGIVFLWTLILIALSLALTCILSLFLYFARKHERWRKETFQMARSPALRALLFVWPPITLFTCWQWRLGKSDAWLPILLSVVAWLSTTLGLLWAGWMSIKKGEVSAFKMNRWWAFMPLGVLSFVKLAVLGFAQGYGERQVVTTIILEFIRTLFLIIGRPFRQARWNVAASLISVLQLIQVCILEGFVPRQNIKPIPRAALGFISIVVQTLGFLLLFGYSLVLLLILIIRIVKRRQTTPEDRAERLEEEKVYQGVSHHFEQQHQNKPFSGQSTHHIEQERSRSFEQNSSPSRTLRNHLDDNLTLNHHHNVNPIFGSTLPKDSEIR